MGAVIRRTQLIPAVMVAAIVVTVFSAMLPCRAEAAYPGAEWENRTPESLGMNGAALDKLAAVLGGRGCVVKDGYVVKSWGDQAEKGDWFSSAKPVLTTLLFHAIEEGLVPDMDSPVSLYGWDLSVKDRGITFRHLTTMSSGYARPEGPGEAWAYNDFAIQLYQQTLFDRVFKDDPVAVLEHPDRLGALGLQDGFVFRTRNRRMLASVRDFARIAWFWCQRGEWNGRQVLPGHYFDEFCRPLTSPDLPPSAVADTDDYLGIGSFGGGSKHFTEFGAGTYGGNWWFNATGLLHPDAISWPDAPEDTFMSVGWGGNSAAIIPSRGLVLACASGNWGNHVLGDDGTHLDNVLELLTAADEGGGAGVRDVVEYSGDFRLWHGLTLTFDGPDTHEDGVTNPFRDYRLDVTFSKDGRSFVVPGYYCADGNAAVTGASAGDRWRVRFAPDEEGEWEYSASFRVGPNVAIADDPDSGVAVAFDGLIGTFTVGPSGKRDPDFRRAGRLEYVGERYLRFAGSGDWYLKGGADSPENFLAYDGFDQTPPSHRFEPHVQDWREGDPLLRGGGGKGIIGALNYLSSMDMNNVYFLTMNVAGDGKDVWPWTGPDERFRFDVSKLAQWEIVFEHMDRLGLLMHVVLQEQENDQLLDGGELGPERRMYFRELIARFGHHPALVWNLGEENTNTTAQLKDFAGYFEQTDPYAHPVVVHTFPGQYEKVYRPLVGSPLFEGPSLQLGNMRGTHAETIRWLDAAEDAGRQWVTFLDEIGPADAGVVPDADDPDHDDVRNFALWGNLMAGGAGSEWLFGYKYAHHDLSCEDWRSRDEMWRQTAIAINFFRDHLPFTEMRHADDLTPDADDYCLAKPGEVYAVYLPEGGAARLDLSDATGAFTVTWFDPKRGGDLRDGSVTSVNGSGVVSLGTPPAGEGPDWVVVVRKRN
jgi:CubicO group peptidase (beta-lactamase class C family)